MNVGAMKKDPCFAEWREEEKYVASMNFSKVYADDEAHHLLHVSGEKIVRFNDEGVRAIDFMLVGLQIPKGLAKGTLFHLFTNKAEGGEKQTSYYQNLKHGFHAMFQVGKQLEENRVMIVSFKYQTLDGQNAMILNRIGGR